MDVTDTALWVAALRMRAPILSSSGAVLLDVSDTALAAEGFVVYSPAIAAHGGGPGLCDSPVEPPREYIGFSAATPLT